MQKILVEYKKDNVSILIEEDQHRWYRQIHRKCRVTYRVDPTLHYTVILEDVRYSIAMKRFIDCKKVIELGKTDFISRNYSGNISPTE